MLDLATLAAAEARLGKPLLPPPDADIAGRERVAGPLAPSARPPARCPIHKPPAASGDVR
jgi:hypothetical protein